MQGKNALEICEGNFGVAAEKWQPLFEKAAAADAVREGFGSEAVASKLESLDADLRRRLVTNNEAEDKVTMDEVLSVLPMLAGGPGGK